MGSSKIRNQLLSNFKREEPGHTAIKSKQNQTPESVKNSMFNVWIHSQPSGLLQGAWLTSPAPCPAAYTAGLLGFGWLHSTASAALFMVLSCYQHLQDSGVSAVTGLPFHQQPLTGFLHCAKAHLFSATPSCLQNQ